MKRNTLIGFVITAIVLGGMFFFIVEKPSTVKAPGDTGAMILPPGTYVEHGAGYDIAANYATSTPLKGGANTAAIARMENFISDTITQFKIDGKFTNRTAHDLATLNGPKEKLQIVYLLSSSPHTVSYIFTLYEDTGGAHGNIFFHTFTFNTDTGALVNLPDLFAPNTPYLQTLSSISQAKLPGIIGSTADANFIQNGTAPKEANFQNFFLDNNFLVVLFAPYTVAPYSAGPQTLRIPLNELGTILQSPYRP